MKASTISKKPTCAAKLRRKGTRCQKWPIKGSNVCRLHGGSAPQVRRKAAERLADLIDPDRALRTLAAMAYSDLRQLFDEHGNLLPVHQWSDDMAQAVSSVEVIKKNITTGDGKMDDVHKVRLWDKPRSMEMLLKHLGLLVDRLEVSGAESLLSKVNKARARVAASKTS